MKAHRNLIAILLWVAGLICITGCATTTPAVPKTLNYATPQTMYSLSDFDQDLKDYRAAYKANQIDEATRLRNSMIQRIRVEIELNYKVFVGDLSSGRAAFETAADFEELAMAAAITITGGARVKTVLGAILTATKGVRISYDKNWFKEKTTETIIAAMEAERNKKLLIITGKMANSTAAQYTFDEAQADLVDFFYAGTLEGGIVALSSETGKSASDAKNDVQNAERQRIWTLQRASAQAIISVEQLTDRLRALVQKPDQAEAKRILGALTPPIVPKAGEDVFDLLWQQIDALQPGDAAGLSRLAKAFGIGQ